MRFVAVVVVVGLGLAAARPCAEITQRKKCKKKSHRCEWDKKKKTCGDAAEISAETLGLGDAPFTVVGAVDFAGLTAAEASEDANAAVLLAGFEAWAWSAAFVAIEIAPTKKKGKKFFTVTYGAAADTSQGASDLATILTTGSGHIVMDHVLSATDSSSASGFSELKVVALEPPSVSVGDEAGAVTEGGAGAVTEGGADFEGPPCEDSDHFRLSGQECAAVASDGRCDAEGSERVAVACAKACGPNHNDFHDSETFSFTHKKKQRDCAWLAKNKWKRKWGRICGWHKDKRGAEVASVACAASCGACAASGATTTAAAATTTAAAATTAAAEGDDGNAGTPCDDAKGKGYYAIKDGRLVVDFGGNPEGKGVPTTGCKGTVRGGLRVGFDPDGVFDDVSGDFDMGDVTGFTGSVTVQNLQGNSTAGFERLEHVGLHLTFEDSPEHADLRGFDAVTFVGGNVVISDNAKLESIGLGKLEHFRPNTVGYKVGGDVTISRNPSLATLGAASFASLTEAGYIYVAENDKLETMDAFKALVSVMNVNINHNAALVRVDGFDELKVVDGEAVYGEGQGHLRLDYNDALEHIGGFGKLETIMDFLGVVCNDAMKTITGFGSLHSIFDELDVFVCAPTNQWEDVSGLSRLAHVTNGCEADQIVLDAAPGCGGDGGSGAADGPTPTWYEGAQGEDCTTVCASKDEVCLESSFANVANIDDYTALFKTEKAWCTGLANDPHRTAPSVFSNGRPTRSDCKYVHERPTEERCGQKDHLFARFCPCGAERASESGA